MKIIKKNLKLFIGIIIGAVISGISVYAVSSNSISYNAPSGWNVSTVDAALNDLYDKAYAPGDVNLARFASENDTMFYGLTGVNKNFPFTEDNYKVNKQTTNYSFESAGDFEISVLTYVDNSQAGYMGGFKVSFLANDTSVMEIQYIDGYGSSVSGVEKFKLNGNSLYDVAGAGTRECRYALVRRGSTISVYRDDTLLTTTEYSGAISIDKVELRFYKYGTYTPPVSVIREIYLGDIKNYDSN